MLIVVRDDDNFDFCVISSSFIHQSYQGRGKLFSNSNYSNVEVFYFTNFRNGTLRKETETYLKLIIILMTAPLRGPYQYGDSPCRPHLT